MFELLAAFTTAGGANKKCAFAAIDVVCKLLQCFRRARAAPFAPGLARRDDLTIAASSPVATQLADLYSDPARDEPEQRVRVE